MDVLREAFYIAVVKSLAAKTCCITTNIVALIGWIVSNAELTEFIARSAGKEAGEVKIWDWDEVTGGG